MKVKDEAEWTSVTQDTGLGGGGTVPSENTHIKGYPPHPQCSRLSLGNPISKA